MKKIFLLAGLFALINMLTLKAQVTIGANNPPSKNALLDLKETAGGTSTKGLLLPRVSLQSTTSAYPMLNHEAGMFVYNTNSTNTGTNDVSPGIYYNDGSKWVKESGGAPSFFYMPSIILPVDTSDPAYNSGSQSFTVDLYAKYKDQFTLTATSSPVKSPNATTPLPLYAKTELEYFVTYYDNAVFSSVSVDNNGVMTYKLVSSPVFSEKTYMNIIFQVK